jgi:hypothetical protein
MDGMTEADLRQAFINAFNTALGTSADPYSRLTVVNRLSRRLADHFDATGWPETPDEVSTYVRQALDRYG